MPFLKLFITLALSMTAPYLLKVKAGKIKPVLHAWVRAERAYHRAMLDDELTLEESDEVSDKIIEAMQATIDAIKGK